MIQEFEPGDKVKYKADQRYAAKDNMHDADKVYTVNGSTKSATYFEESPYFCCTYRLEKVENNMKKHKHHDLIVKWAANPDGYTVYYRSCDGEWSIVSKPIWREDVEYKLVQKSKVKKWRWVFKDIYGQLNLTNKWWTQESFENQFPNFTLVQKIDSTMIEE